MGRPRKRPAKKSAPTYDDERFVSDDAFKRFCLYSKNSSLLDLYIIDFNKIGGLELHDVVQLFDFQQCSDLLSMNEPGYNLETFEFYANLHEDDSGNLVTKVHKRWFDVTAYSINNILGYADYHLGDYVNVYPSSCLPKDVKPPRCNPNQLCHKYFGKPVNQPGRPEEYKISKLECNERIAYEMVARTLVPKGGDIHVANYTTMCLFYYVMEKIKINPGYAVVKHMVSVANAKKVVHNLPYSNLITRFLKEEARQEEGSSFQFVGEPKPCLFYDVDYFSKMKGWTLVMNKWVKTKPGTGSEGDETGLEGKTFFQSISSGIKRLREEVSNIRIANWRNRHLLRGIERAHNKRAVVEEQSNDLLNQLEQRQEAEPLEQTNDLVGEDQNQEPSHDNIA